MRPAHYPGRAPVDSYGNGRFRFAQMEHVGSILCLPSGIHAWPVHDVNSLSLDNLAPALTEADGFNVLIVGTGKDIVPICAPLKGALRAAGIMVEVMGTGPAVRTFNVLLAEDRLVAAALFPVD